MPLFLLYPLALIGLITVIAFGALLLIVAVDRFTRTPAGVRELREFAYREPAGAHSSH